MMDAAPVAVMAFDCGKRPGYAVAAAEGALAPLLVRWVQLRREGDGLSGH